MGDRLAPTTEDLSLRFALPGGGHALFTTRAEGNLSTMRGPDHEYGRRERDRLCRQLGLRWLCASRQVHGTSVQRVVEQTGRGGQAVEIDADGHATALPELGAMVLVADCLPVILGSEGVVAAVHAGWRGLAGGVLEEGVRAVRELGGSGEVAALIGPGARGCCYEVGEEVHRALGAGELGRAGSTSIDRPGSSISRAVGTHQGAGGAHHRAGGAHHEGRSNLDLAAVARERLEAAGVTRIEDVGVCTICDERLFSHRREGLQAGRQAGIAWIE